MPTNNFVPFANNLSNVMSLATYDPLAPSGNVPGIASSSMVNRAIRQGTTIASIVAQLMLNVTGIDVADTQDTPDTAIPTVLYAQLVASLAKIPKVVWTQLTGSGTTAPPTAFFTNTPSVQPNTSSTYTDAAGVTYAVLSSAVFMGVNMLVMIPTSGFATPSLSGTLTRASGTGDATITAYCRKTALYGQIFLQGGGGGGGGCATAAASASCGGGGGGGASLRATIGQLGTSLSFAGYAWAVGAGGAGGTAGNNAGANGNATTFSTFTANAGGQGFGSAAVTSFPGATGLAGNGGLGSSLSTAGVNQARGGGSGTVGWVFSSSSMINSMNGETLLQGPVTVGIAAQAGIGIAIPGADGTANTGQGGGGANQVLNSGARAGGAGAAGFLQAEWFFQ